jgi:hypothetical protein
MSDEATPTPIISVSWVEELKNALIPVRFHLPTGETLTLNCQYAQTLAEVKGSIWNKKAHLSSFRKDHFCIRLKDGEVSLLLNFCVLSLRLTSLCLRSLQIYFRDEHTIFDCLEPAAIFRESSKTNLLPEFVVYPLEDVGDKHKREVRSFFPFSLVVSFRRSLLNLILFTVSILQTLMATPHLPVYSGYLNKKGDGVMAGWKRRFFVLQDNTLFYFADEKAYKVRHLSLTWLCPIHLPPLFFRTRRQLWVSFPWALVKPLHTATPSRTSLFASSWKPHEWANVTSICRPTTRRPSPPG